MKSGASDPFGDDDEEAADDGGDPGANGAANATAATTPKPERSESGAGAESTGEAGESGASSGTQSESSDGQESGSEDAGTDSEPDAGGLSRDQLPFVLRRDRVKDERPEVHQLFVQQETHEEAVEAERRLEDALDDDLSRTDAREAIYRAGMQHLDDAEAILREWGYDL